MKREDPIAEQGDGKVSIARLALVGTPIVFLAYAVVLAIVKGFPLVITLASAAANTIPTVLVGLPAYRIVGKWLVGRSTPAQIAGHIALCVIYSVLTYWLLLVLLGVVNSASVWRFNVQYFPYGASFWQLLQNATIYGIIATLAYVGRGPEVTVVLSDDGDGGPSAMSRYFIRSGDDIKPIDVHSIVSIAGADDYAEVRTTESTHLVRMTLAELERSLDSRRFIRVHRSRIVNLERIFRAEPAGSGRLLLHMEDGETIAASRSGSKLLKDRVL